MIIINVIMLILVAGLACCIVSVIPYLIFDNFYSTYKKQTCVPNGEVIHKITFNKFLKLYKDKKYNWERDSLYPKSHFDYRNGGHIHANIIQFDSRYCIMCSVLEFYKYEIWLLKNKYKKDLQYINWD